MPHYDLNSKLIPDAERLDRLAAELEAEEEVETASAVRRAARLLRDEQSRDGSGELSDPARGPDSEGSKA
jgi:hypothetical protein